jgi:hypothetical protein
MPKFEVKVSEREQDWAADSSPLQCTPPTRQSPLQCTPPARQSPLQCMPPPDRQTALQSTFDSPQAGAPLQSVDSSPAVESASLQCEIPDSPRVESAPLQCETTDSPRVESAPLQCAPI